MGKTAAVFCALLALSAFAGEITSIYPPKLQAGPEAQFIELTGEKLGDRVLFSGPAGEFDVEASWRSVDGVAVWVPIKVLIEPGRYSVISHDGRTRSAPVTLEIVPGRYHPLVVLVPDPVTRPAESKEGAHVDFEVWTYGGRDPNPSVSCDARSGQMFPIGPTTVACRASNIYGERSTGFVFIFVYDTGLPVVRVPYRIVAQAESDEGSKIEFEATASDVVDGPLPVRCDPSSGSLFPIGVTWVECTATDSTGNTGHEVFAIEIIDPNPDKFVIHVPAALNAEAESADGAKVMFEVTADGSDDPRPTIVCDPPSGATFPIGTTRVVCVATDRHGATATGEFTITVVDTIAPLISNLTATPDVLEPPNHKFVPVEITVDVADVVDPSPQCAILDLTSNQDIESDVEITGALRLELRAERDGGKERVYSIRVQCTDSSGNTALGTVTVLVPKGGDDQQQEVTVPSPPPVSRRRSVGRG
jgi:HYR domain-containing protein